LAKIQRMNTSEKQTKQNPHGSALKNHQRTVIPTPLRGGGRKKNKTKGNENEQNNIINMPQPLRGGGNKSKNGHSTGSSVTQFFNHNMRNTSTSSLLPQYKTNHNTHYAMNGNHGRNASRHQTQDSRKQNGYSQMNGAYNMNHSYKKSRNGLRQDSYW